jgi:hypothetical protein
MKHQTLSVIQFIRQTERTSIDAKCLRILCENSRRINILCKLAMHLNETTNYVNVLRSDGVKWTKTLCYQFTIYSI